MRDDNSDPADQDRPTAAAADRDRPAEQPTPLSWTDPVSGVARTDWEQEFVAFFRTSYRTLLVQAQYAGADREDADEAVAATMLDVYNNWSRLDNPLAWARRAVVRFYLKSKARSLDLIRAEQVRRRAGTPQARPDANLTTWEEWQWIRQLLLDLLTPGQQKVMAMILDGYTPTEIADMFEVQPTAVRRQLSYARARLVDAWQNDLRTEPGNRPEARP
ncbi:RNA polymerase sigma factor [Actinoplanes sp. NPDC051513]|uniref:RNA polymerase sigma factor n=1 Tax=Actinoplanes sp. NPDC051513 TaxID=3363908 RepID=UPI0037A17DC5